MCASQRCTKLATQTLNQNSKVLITLERACARIKNDAVPKWKLSVETSDGFFLWNFSFIARLNSVHQWNECGVVSSTTAAMCLWTVTLKLQHDRMGDKRSEFLFSIFGVDGVCTTVRSRVHKLNFIGIISSIRASNRFAIVAWLHMNLYTVYGYGCKFWNSFPFRKFEFAWNGRTKCR